jgi:hypothetical protein
MCAILLEAKYDLFSINLLLIPIFSSILIEAIEYRGDHTQFYGYLICLSNRTRAKITFHPYLLAEINVEVNQGYV